MRHPSRRAHAQAQAEFRRQQAFHNNDHEAFAAVVKELEAVDAAPDIYTCLCCGEDFPHGPHVDLLVCKVLVFGDDGAVVEERDYSPLSDPENNGRRFKVCGKCVEKWAHKPQEYAEIR